MNDKRRFRNLIGFAIAALVASTMGVAGTAAAAPAKSDVAVSGATALSPDVAATAQGSGVDAQQKALASYWTPERMKSAKPDSELPSARAQAATAKPSATEQAKPGGAAGKVEAAKPVAEPKADVKAGAGAKPDVQTQAYYPNYPVGHAVARTYGKVFFTSAGLNYVCSATIVNSEGKSIVWTAGHCNTSGQAWHYNWTFVPNYVNGSAPYGYWYAYQLWSTNAWFYNNNDWANDVGSAVLYRNNGWRITDYLGGQGITWNQAVSYFAYAFGYPQGPPFNGCCLVGEYGQTYNGGGGTIYMVNYMTGGSSGGAWLYGFDGNWGYINGHNDFKYNAYPQYMYSPYYGNQVAGLYGSVRYLST